MLKSKLQFQDRKGFTLIELVLGISLISMILLTFLSLFSFVLKVNERDLLKDEMLLNGRYTSEYIKEEISSADKIIVSSLFYGLNEKFKRNMGFVILKIDRESFKKEDQYSYTTYFFREDTIVRVNAKINLVKNKEFLTRDILKNLPHPDLFKGYNTMCNSVLDESEIILDKDDIVHLNLFLKDEKTEKFQFESNVFLRCEVLR